MKETERRRTSNTEISQEINEQGAILWEISQFSSENMKESGLRQKVLSKKEKVKRIFYQIKSDSDQFSQEEQKQQTIQNLKEK